MSLSGLVAQLWQIIVKFLKNLFGPLEIIVKTLSGALYLCG